MAGLAAVLGEGGPVAEWTCLGCGGRHHACGFPEHLCPDCHEAWLEWLVHAIDPHHDPAVMHDWTECERIHDRLYGRGAPRIPGRG